MVKNPKRLSSALLLSVILHIIVISILYINFSNNRVEKNSIESAKRVINGDNRQFDDKDFKSGFFDMENHPIIPEVKIADSKNQSSEVLMREQLSKLSGTTVSPPSDNVSMFATTKETLNLKEKTEISHNDRIVSNDRNANHSIIAESRNEIFYANKDPIQADEIAKIESQNSSNSKIKETSTQLNNALDEIKNINKQNLERKRQEELLNITTDVNVINE